MKTLVTTLSLATLLAAAITPGTIDPLHWTTARLSGITAQLSAELGATSGQDESGPRLVIPAHHEETPRK